GRGPQLNDGQTMLTESSLNGGYVLATYKIDGLRWGTLFPFVKWQHFKGGQKFERNTPRNHVNDLEFGLEWQVMKEIELTAVYHMMNRTNLASAPYERYKADVLRFQLQWNY
ncbi:porin, partial [Nitrosomonas europaea]|uniref:porin n=1 Tax=Nitrosomonas europaea TaxID=915 RepID=UPI000791C613